MLRCYSRKILTQLMLLLVPLILRQAPVVTSYSYESSKILRDKRYLVFPLSNSPAVTKVQQLIMGLGLPMEIDVSTIIGYVTKLNYLLPTNASYLTDTYVRYARFNDKADTPTCDGNSKGASFTRYDLYRMITNAIEGFRLGKACLLKIICEFAEVPLSKESGIAAELLHTLITPSTSTEKIRDPADQEYLAAEMMGQLKLPGLCKMRFPECNSNILEYFTEIRSH